MSLLKVKGVIGPKLCWKKVRSTGYICLLGIGLGLTLSSLLLYKLFGGQSIFDEATADSEDENKKKQRNLNNSKQSSTTSKVLNRKTSDLQIEAMGQTNSKVNPVYSMSELDAQYGDHDSQAVGLAATLESQRAGVLLRSQLSASSCCSGNGTLDSASEQSRSLEEEEPTVCYDNGAYMKTADNTPHTDKSVETTLLTAEKKPSTCMLPAHSSLDDDKEDSTFKSSSMKDSGFIESSDLTTDQQMMYTNSICNEVTSSDMLTIPIGNGELRSHPDSNGECGRSESPPLTPAEVRRQIYAAHRNYTVATPSPAHSYRDRSRSRSSSLMSLNCSLDSECLADLEPFSMEPYVYIDGELQSLNNELDDIDSSLSRLKGLYSEEGPYTSLGSIPKLCRILTETESILSSQEITKAYGLLRKYSDMPREHERFKRLSSLPPQIRERRGSLTPQEESPTFFNDYEPILMTSHSCHNMRHMIVLGSSEYDWKLEPLSDSTSVSSNTTLETNLNDSNLRSSMESINSLSIASPSESNSPQKQEAALCRCPKVDLMEYALSEWRGDTIKSKTIRQGYFSVSDDYNYTDLISIRGDNYCALRATLCSLVMNQSDINHQITDATFHIDRLTKIYETRSDLVHSWNFANRFGAIPEVDKLDKLILCINVLSLKLQQFNCLETLDQKDVLLASFLNTSSIEELTCLEAMKILMLLSAVDLHTSYSAGTDVPVFAYLLFSRDTSETLEDLVSKHLNKCGDAAGLDHIDMCLLGYSLGCSIQVYRPYLYGKEDFYAYFPELSESEQNNIIPLIAEDDRHYNVIIKQPSSKPVFS